MADPDDKDDGFSFTTEELKEIEVHLDVLTKVLNRRKKAPDGTPGGLQSSPSSKSSAACDCGAHKTGGAHSDWCSTQGMP